MGVCLSASYMVYLGMSPWVQHQAKANENLEVLAQPLCILGDDPICLGRLQNVGDKLGTGHLARVVDIGEIGGQQLNRKCQEMNRL